MYVEPALQPKRRNDPKAVQRNHREDRHAPQSFDASSRLILLETKPREIIRLLICQQFGVPPAQGAGANARLTGRGDFDSGSGYYAPANVTSNCKQTSQLKGHELICNAGHCAHIEITMTA
ncbi:hypothetical protein FPOAC2_11085 [Fusarium poae]